MRIERVSAQPRAEGSRSHPRRPPRRLRACLALLLFWGSGAEAAGSWIAGRGSAAAGARSAGYGANGAFEGLWFSCEAAGPGVLRLIVAGPGWRFDHALDQTVVASVDGTAYLFSSMPEARPEGGGDRLVHAAPAAAFEPLIAALTKGRRVEISTPAGRYSLPLGGSGKALAALKAGCG